jgi:hypothetical protein
MGTMSMVLGLSCHYRSRGALTAPEERQLEQGLSLATIAIVASLVIHISPVFFL